MFVSIAINTILNRDEQLQFTNCPLHGIVSRHISVQLLLNGNKMKKEKLNCSNCGAFCREENNKWCASAKPQIGIERNLLWLCGHPWNYCQSKLCLRNPLRSTPSWIVSELKPWRHHPAPHSCVGLDASVIHQQTDRQAGERIVTHDWSLTKVSGQHRKPSPYMQLRYGKQRWSVHWFAVGLVVELWNLSRGSATRCSLSSVLWVEVKVPHQLFAKYHNYGFLIDGSNDKDHSPTLSALNMFRSPPLSTYMSPRTRPSVSVDRKFGYKTHPIIIIVLL